MLKINTLVNFGTIGILFGPLVLAGPLGETILAIIVITLLLFELIFRILIFAMAIYIFWVLVLRFAQIVILTVFSPLFLGTIAIPGMEGVAGNWVKRMLCNALTFPAILVLIYLAIGLLSSGILGVPIGGSLPQAPPPIEGITFGGSAA